MNEQYDREKIEQVLEKAVYQRMNQIKYLLDIDSENIYKAECAAYLHNEYKDCEMALAYMRRNLK